MDRTSKDRHQNGTERETGIDCGLLALMLPNKQTLVHNNTHTGETYLFQTRIPQPEPHRDQHQPNEFSRNFTETQATKKLVKAFECGTNTSGKRGIKTDHVRNIV